MPGWRTVIKIVKQKVPADVGFDSKHTGANARARACTSQC